VDPDDQGGAAEEAPLKRLGGAALRYQAPLESQPPRPAAVQVRARPLAVLAITKLLPDADFTVIV
jgi:hypothetical protein